MYKEIEAQKGLTATTCLNKTLTVFGCNASSQQGNQNRNAGYEYTWR